jgi:hypothetical protein
VIPPKEGNVIPPNRGNAITEKSQQPIEPEALKRKPEFLKEQRKEQLKETNSSEAKQMATWKDEHRRFRQVHREREGLPLKDVLSDLGLSVPEGEAATPGDED